MDSVIKTLLVFAGSVVVDGFLLEWLNHIPSLADVLTLACIGFSGPGCVSTAVTLKGPISKRLYHVACVYVTVGIAAGIVVLLHPILRGLLPPSIMKTYVGLYLFSLGLSLSGMPALRCIAHWPGCGAAAQVMLAMMLSQALQQGFSRTILWEFSVDWKVFPPLALALVIGCVVTALGAVLGLALSEATLIPLKSGAACSLITTSVFVYLGIPLPLGVPTTALTLGPLALGLIWTVTVAVFKQPPQILR
jgi:hypothetical protein